MDSSLPDEDEGMIGKHQREWLRKQLKEYEKDERKKIFMLHHHVLPVHNVGRERNILYDAGDMLKLAQSSGIDLIVCGHRHQHQVWLIEDIVVVNVGTSFSEKLIRHNTYSYNIITIMNKELKIELKEVGGDRKVMAHYDPSKLGVCKLS